MDTGLGFVQPLFFIGVVENRNDPTREGRVQVRAFGVHGSIRDVPTEDLPWATLIIGNHDVNFTPPPLNAWVFGFFLDGRDAQQPMILGLIPTQTLDLIDPSVSGWGAVPMEDYDRQAQGARPRDVGLSPLSRLATAEFINETNNLALETNRSTEIPIAGGCITNHAPSGNNNAWSTDAGESESVPAQPAQPSRPVSASEAERIRQLDNDPEFQRELQQVMQRHGVTREQVYGIIAGESSYNPSIRNQYGYVGLFQFSDRNSLPDINRRFGTNYTAAQVQRMTPGQQMRVYGQWLDVWSARGWSIGRTGGLGIIQAAPGRSSYGRNQVVYPRGSREWQANPGWRGSDGEITVASINAYYERRNPPPNSNAAAPADPEEPQVTPEQERLTEGSPDNSAITNRQTEIRNRIRTIDEELQRLRTSTVRDPEVLQMIEELEQEKAALEEELAGLNGAAGTESQAGESYSGYAEAQNSNCTNTWSEPASAYAAQYPYNRVVETASGHSIEMDDTPGAERIMIWHRSGSYIQISNNSTTHKHMVDSHDIHERNHHVYIRGNNIVTIDGDCYTLVKGDKIEEIQGDYRQIVHGSINVGAAHRIEINGAERTDIRSASLGLDSNVENMNIRTGRNIVFQSGDSINFRSRNIRLQASDNLSIIGNTGLFLESDSGIHLKSDGNIFINPSQNLFLRADGGTISAQASGSFRVNTGQFIALQSGSTLDLQAKSNLLIGSKATINVSADDIVSLRAGGDLFSYSAGETNIKSSAGAYIESSAGLNLLAAQDARLTGNNTVHIVGTTTYIDDLVELASGAGVSASPAAEKENINPAPYQGEFENSDTAPAADSAPAAEIPMDTTSPATDAPSEPPAPAISETDYRPTSDDSETTPPSISTSPVNVQEQATSRGAIDTNDTNLIGVFGTPDNRRAMVRTPDGQIVRVSVGDLIGDSVISQIGENSITYTRGSTTRTINIAN